MNTICFKTAHENTKTTLHHTKITLMDRKECTEGVHKRNCLHHTILKEQKIYDNTQRNNLNHMILNETILFHLRNLRTNVSILDP